MRKIKAYCDWPFNKVKLNMDGDIKMCCHQRHDHSLGNVFQQSFDNIWFGPTANEVRRTVLHAKMHEMCNTAECPYRYKDIATLGSYKESDMNDNGYPIELEFDLHSTHCNFGGTEPTPETACFMCPRALPGFMKYIEGHRDRTDELVQKIKFLMPDLKILNILGVAEPFWKDKIFDVMDSLDFKSHRDHIWFWTTSNGSIFTKKRQEHLGEMTRKTLLNFSLDAATPETFTKIRRQNLFQQVCDNVRSWTSYRRELNKQGAEHTVSIHNNINIYNVREVPEMVRLAHDLGVDALTMIPTHDVGGTFYEISHLLVNEKNAHIFQQAEDEARQVAEKLDFSVHFTRPLALGYNTELVQIKLI